MKSALFECLSDRSNIANAYLKIVNEANDDAASDIDYISSLYGGKKHPLCVYRIETGSAVDDVIDLDDICGEYRSPDYYYGDDDDYYITLAIDKYDTDELYRLILEQNPDFFMSPEEAYASKNGFLRTYNDVLSAIESVGRDIEERLHADDVEVKIPEWAASYIVNGDDSGLTSDDKRMVDEYVDDIVTDGYELVYDGRDLGFCNSPEFGDAANCIRFYLEKRNGAADARNESVEDGAGGWFDKNGYIIKDIPDSCIEDCTVPGRDAYGVCSDWVDELGFDRNLDIPMAKGYLRATGGWDDAELKALSPRETAIRLLWVLCGEYRDGNKNGYIGQYGRLGESVVDESTYRGHKVILTDIQWPEAAYSEDRELPQMDSLELEVCEEREELDDVIKGIYYDSFGVAPVKYRISRDIDYGPVEVDDAFRHVSGKKKNEMVSQKEVDELKKKNPRLKNISEER